MTQQRQGIGREFREFREFGLLTGLIVTLLGGCAGSTRTLQMRGPALLEAQELGKLKTSLDDGKLTSERQSVRMKVDGVPVKVEFAVTSVQHPQRTLGYTGVTHEYDMKLLRHMHGYKRDQAGRYFWDQDSDDPHSPGVDLMDESKGKEFDAFLQRSVELWVDRGLTLMLLDLEQQLR